MFSLTRVETAKHVDFEDGVVWILALGSDARPGEEAAEARTDAIQLVGINFETGSAVGIGIPRDAWVEIPGSRLRKINAALADRRGPSRWPRRSRDLVGHHAGLRFVAGFAGFADMVDAIDGVDVRSAIGLQRPRVRPHRPGGPNRFDGPRRSTSPGPGSSAAEETSTGPRTSSG